MGEIEPMLTGGDVARALNVSTRTVEQWRQRGQGPNFHKIGRNVRYAEDDVRKFVANGRRERRGG